MHSTDSFHGVNTPTMPASKLPCDMVKMGFRIFMEANFAQYVHPSGMIDIKTKA